MELEVEKKPEKSGATNGITKTIPVFQWADNITCLDLSNNNLKYFDEKVSFPSNLLELNLAHNNFWQVPAPVLNLESLKVLNIAFNYVDYFDDAPKFLHAIEHLNLSHNRLAGPPHWIWFERPQKLTRLKLDNNPHITNVLKEDYFVEILQRKTSITEVNMANCRLRNHQDLLKTFPKATVMEIGHADLSFFMSNNFEQIPGHCLDKCCDIERLIASNTHIHTIDANIANYANLVHIDLSQNHINSLPEEFSDLTKLEVCILSNNIISYLPSEISKMERLVCLRVDCNDLCMLPDDLSALKNLQVLDLYDNVLAEVPACVMNVPELDLAMNHLDEPDDQNYLERKERLRLNMPGRLNGKKIEVERSDSECHSSTEFTDNEEIVNSMNNMDLNKPNSDEKASKDDKPDGGNDSSEDWDSDDYWVPHYLRPEAPSQSQWINFVQRKMKEGNFCPMDQHVVSISEKVKYDKLINPTQYMEVDGQFSDYSDDTS